MNEASWLRRHASPAATVLSSLILVSALALAPKRVTSLAVALPVVVLSLLASRARPSTVLRGVSFAWLALVALLLPQVLAGHAGAALATFVRATLAVITALGFAHALAPGELGGALAALGVPYAVSGVIETMLRQVPTLGREGGQIALALRLRGARGTNLATSVFASLLERSVLRAERVDLAMQLRGYVPTRAAELAALRGSDAPVLAFSLCGALAVHAVAAWR